jgi:probable rRNA maturation factor
MQFPEFPDEDEGAVGQDVISFHSEDVDTPEPLLRAGSDVEAWLRAAAASEGKPLAELTYIFCSDEYLHQINLEYLQHDYYTDVITFPYNDDAIHGDVFISTERVADNARTLGVAFQRELFRVMVHGLLHLAGYRDETDEQEAAMRTREDYYLAKIDR